MTEKGVKLRLLGLEKILIFLELAELIICPDDILHVGLRVSLFKQKAKPNILSVLRKFERFKRSFDQKYKNIILIKSRLGGTELRTGLGR